MQISLRLRRIALLAAFLPILAVPHGNMGVAHAMSTNTLSSHPACQRGTLACVKNVVREMTRRFDVLAAHCDHKAVFSLLYLRTTEEYRRTVAKNSSFFADTAYVNHQDALFADYYFLAMDSTAAELAAVPLAWQIANDAADRREVTGAGNIMLGMSAHINRDLPFVLEAKGLTHLDGSSRKPDHDKVNEILRRVLEGPVLSEAAHRFDPSIAAIDAPGTRLDTEVFFGLVKAWRERAWQNAARLAAAENSARRQLVANEIEQIAAAEALALKETNAYRPPLTSAAARDAYCATTQGQ